ncbi:LacI family DNA-binding transcriptional regulator [Pantoea sp. A4]|uniref:LacI family DNA-binding transcriptional regulator n=1 Tax=Pantoea sp. A4 TaxID=1225184 RepID=UPI0003819F8A|nr:LacI family DNA-binding transcriptional regulator [Pantoea sp. A4]
MSGIKKTTLEQIAEAAGVSLSTVDRVMNRRGGVSPAREARVLEWAHRLNVDRVMFRAYMRMLRVAILMQSPKNPFYLGLRNAFNDIGPALAEMRLHCDVHYLQLKDVNATVRQIHGIASAYDALIVVCPDDPDLAATLRQVAMAMPVITLVTDIPDCGRLAYVGPDNAQMGRVAGELSGRFIGPQGGELLVVLGMKSMIGQGEREAGFRAVLASRYPSCQVVTTLESGENPRRAGDLVSRALSTWPGIRGIYNISSGNSNIVQALRAHGKEKQVVLITHELTADRRRLLLAGSIDAIIDQNPWEEARRALEVLARHFNRAPEPENHSEHTPFQIYLRENCPAEGQAAYGFRAGNR